MDKGYDVAPYLQTYQSNIKKDSRRIYRYYTKFFELFEVNSKKIKVDNLGGPGATKSKLFNWELNNLKNLYSENFKVKNPILKDQIGKSYKIDTYIKGNKKPF